MIRSARYFHVAPWEMVDRATAAKIGKDWWLLWATISENAENRATRLLHEGKA